MAEVRKPNKICAVCGKGLGEVTDKTTDEHIGWEHPGNMFGFPEDHPTVPVDYDESLLVSVCDFCGDTVPLAERHYLPVADFEIQVVNGPQTLRLPNSGGYSCCLICTTDLQKSPLDWGHMWDRFISNYEARRGALDEITLKINEGIWDSIKVNVLGPVRKWMPGDEAALNDADLLATHKSEAVQIVRII